MSSIKGIGYLSYQLYDFTLKLKLKMYYVIADDIEKKISSINLNFMDKGRVKREIDEYINDHELYQSELIHTTFLQLYSVLEEYLFHFGDKDTVKNGSGLNRFTRSLKTNEIKIDSVCWKILQNCAQVRNALLHANGRLDLLSDRKKFNQAISKINESGDLIKVVKLWEDDNKHNRLSDLHGKNLPTPERIQLAEGFLKYFYDACNKLFK